MHDSSTVGSWLLGNGPVLSRVVLTINVPNSQYEQKVKQADEQATSKRSVDAPVCQKVVPNTIHNNKTTASASTYESPEPGALLMPAVLMRAPNVPVKSTICRVVMVSSDSMDARENTPLAKSKVTMSHMTTNS